MFIRVASVTKVKIVTTVPIENANEVRQAIGAAGGGQDGEYTYCSFSVVGEGRFMPSAQANPHIGTANELSVVEEERIEVLCDREFASKVLKSIREAHPYEQVPVQVYPLIDEAEL